VGTAAIGADGFTAAVAAPVLVDLGGEAATQHDDLVRFTAI
jgi:hypothetical protein